MESLLLQFATVVILIMMTMQDFKYRAISWFLFPLLAVVAILSNSQFNIADGVLNMTFVGLNLALTTLVVSVKHKKFINLFASHLGLGDLFMFLCLSLYFTPLSFFLFYLWSLIFIAISTGIYIMIKRPLQFTVPLAGLQALLLLLHLLSSSFLSLNIHYLESYKGYQL